MRDKHVKKRVITTWVREYDWEKLEEIAEEENRTKSFILRNVLCKYVEEYEKQHSKKQKNYKSKA